jgi:hypothetical protein
MTAAITNRLRKICLTLPEAAEKEAWGDPTFRVKDKIFGMEKRGDGRVSVWFKAPPGSQHVLIGAAPETFFRPAYVATRAGSVCGSTRSRIGKRSRRCCGAATS